MDNFFPGICCGIIVFQTAFIAPILTKALTGDVFSAVVRTIWPRFFLALAVTGCCSLLTDIVSNGSSNVRISVIVLTIILPAICYGLIPATNAATDGGRKAQFKVLHTSSILLTVFTLLLNAACIWL